jgi:hypothetical protein
MAPVSAVPSAFARIAEIESRFAPVANAASASTSTGSTSAGASATGTDSGFGSVLQSLLGAQGTGGYGVLGGADDGSGSDLSGLSGVSGLSNLSGASGVSSGIDLRKLAAALRGAQLGPGALDGVEASGTRSRSRRSSVATSSGIICRRPWRSAAPASRPGPSD